MDNTPGGFTRDVDHGSPYGRHGLGVEAHDIVAMTDRMVRDMLASPRLAGDLPPPRVILDSAYFRNEGHHPIDENLIVDRLRIELLRAADGRMVFIGGPAPTRTVENEQRRGRKAADEGAWGRPANEDVLQFWGMVADLAADGTQGRSVNADYQLIGAIRAQSRRIPTSPPQLVRYNQISFEMIDLATKEIVWGGIYEFQRAGTRDAIYR